MKLPPNPHYPDLDLQQLPRHVAIIMDGNGRWAELRGKNRLEGHKLGVEVVEDLVTFARELGIKYLTLYAFSQENWERPDDEVDGLMQLLRFFLQSRTQKLINNEVRLKTIGKVDKLAPEVLKELTRAIDATKHCRKLTLNLALSYGSRDEIVDAVNLQIRKAFASGDPAYQVNGEAFANSLYTEFLPDPDLLIRTSGEYRISNFLLWQLAYAELYFTETLWPDFNRDEFVKALSEYQRRERRFGKTSSQVRQC